MKPSYGALLVGLALVAPLFTTSAIAHAAGDTSDRFISAQTQFESGMRGSEKDNSQAAEKFKELTESEPDNPLYLAYYGATFAIKADNAFLPWRKLKLGETGLDWIDKALRKLEPQHDTQLVRGGVPLSIETRLVAITTGFQMPDQFFHRFDRSRALLDQTMKSEVFAKSPPAIQARYWFQAAVAAKKEKKNAEELAALKRVAELDQNSLDVPAAQKRLKELGQ
jgi:tetratricopeptide (TPR) repeat protein